MSKNGKHQQEIWRCYLWSELEKRCQKNQRYSLRAFAQYLQMEPSALSKLMRGKRNFTDKTLRKLSRIGMPAASKTFSRRVARDYLLLTDSAFDEIKDWYHYAILELTRVEGFRPDARYVASRLNIPQAAVNSAVERLVRLGLLEVRGGSWRDVQSHLSNYQEAQSTAARLELQRQIADKARLALDETPREERVNTSMTMAVNSRKLQEAKKKIIRFQRKLCAFLQEGELDEVFQMSVSLFPLTRGCANDK